MSKLFFAAVAAGLALSLAACSSGPNCTVTIQPGGEAMAEHAAVAAAAGDTICFASGNYNFDQQLTIAVPNVTLIGTGATRPILDFKMAMTPEAIEVQSSASNFTIENLEVRNAQENGVRADSVTGVTFRKVKVDWTDASGAEISARSNGTYALYPVGCHQVLIENCEIVGSRDAGLYVGQSQNVVVRYNSVHGNVAGLEIENCIDADVYGNDATDNVSGILVFDLPGMSMLENGHSTRVHDNHSHANNRLTFAMTGSTVYNVPDGVGIMVLAANDTEIDHNLIEENGTTALLMVSYQTLESIPGGPGPTMDVMYDKWLQGTYVHDNMLVHNGTAPSMTAAVQLVLTLQTPPATTLEDQAWDGFINPADMGMADKALCFQQPPATFRNFDALTLASGMTMHMTTDATPYACTHTAHAPITWMGLPQANTVVP